MNAYPPACLTSRERLLHGGKAVVSRTEVVLYVTSLCKRSSLHFEWAAVLCVLSSTVTAGRDIAECTSLVPRTITNRI
jgi:hypothetical protein